MLTPARAKRWVNAPKRLDPFPVGYSTTATVYRGRIHGNGVHVCDPDHVLNLHSMGFFGKGMFSKSAPNYDRKTDGATKVISKRQLEYRHSWQQRQQQPTCAGHTSSDATQEQPSAQSADGTRLIGVVDDTDSEPEATQMDDDDVDVDKTKMDVDVIADPNPLKESLVLSFVEAFFLSYGLGCLIVREGSVEAESSPERYYNLEELWSRYCQLDSSFVHNYVAYHHFRSKGWVPRSGIKFGVDYILYKEGPPFYHASYSVLVKPIEDVTFRTLSSAKDLDWPALFGLNRVTEQAAKDLLLCHVVRPRDVDVTTPTCIDKFKVQETLVKRWVSSAEREQVDDAI